MTDIDVLLSDPVFQLNTLLWSLEEMADAGEIDPVLRKAGFYVTAIGRRLLVPVEPTVLDALAGVAGFPDRSPSRPDLWLKHQVDDVQPIIELTAHGFSPESSNRAQALKMLASAGDLAPSLGGGSSQPGHVVFATIADDAAQLAQTLRELSEALAEAGAAPAPSTAIGFGWVEQGVALVSPVPGELPAPMQAVLADPAVVLRVADQSEDMQPLYLIPWIPGIDDSQDEVLRLDGLRELTARLLTQAIAAIGQARTPTTVTLAGADLLDRATFGVFPRWRDGDRAQFSSAGARLIERALRATGHARIEGDRVEVDLPNEEAQDAAIDRLEKADPSDPAKSLSTAIDEPPTLFDEPASAEPASPQAPAAADPTL